MSSFFSLVPPKLSTISSSLDLPQISSKHHANVLFDKRCRKLASSSFSPRIVSKKRVLKKWVRRTPSTSLFLRSIVTSFQTFNTFKLKPLTHLQHVPNYSDKLRRRSNIQLPQSRLGVRGKKGKEGHANQNEILKILIIKKRIVKGIKYILLSWSYFIQRSAYTHRIQRVMPKDELEECTWRWWRTKYWK